VELFRDGGLLPANVDRMVCLEAFCRYAIQKVTGRKRLVRPPVTVTGSQSLDPLLRGYQGVVLTQALEAAGASSVVFE
jgi:hypothetical protein